MAATSPLNCASAPPLCAPPYLSASPVMSERLFKTEDEDMRRHGQSPRGHVATESVVTSEWRRLEDRGPPARSSFSSATTESTRRALPPPAPHGLRYGSSFPYSAVAATGERDRGLYHHHPQQHDRRVWPQAAPDDDEAKRYTLHRRHDCDDEPRSSIQYRAHEQQQGQAIHGRHDTDLHAWRERGETHQQREMLLNAAQRGRMPSLGSILQRSSFPLDHRDQGMPWRREHDRRDGYLARDEISSRYSGGDVDPSGAAARHERHSLGSCSHQYPISIPGVRRLSSLTEQRSLSPASDFEHSRDHRTPLEPAQSSVSALARVAADISMSDYATRETGTQPSVSRLRSTSYESPHNRSRSAESPSRAAAQARSFPTRAADARSVSRGSLAQSSVASSEEGESRVKVEKDAGPDTVPSDSAAPQRKKKKRKVRICTTPGCDKLVVDHGVCIRHGGGKRCNVEGCDCRAQNKGLCWKHGGYTICQVDGCDKRAKSRGMCWSHGGGTQCKTEGCEKIAVSRGRCWAHGGGKRCKLPDCQKPAALRMDDYCTEHYAAFRATMPNASTGRRGAVDTRALYESWQ